MTTDTSKATPITVTLSREECQGMAAIGRWVSLASEQIGPAHESSLDVAIGLRAIHRVLEAAREVLVTPGADPGRTAATDQKAAAAKEALEGMILEATMYDELRKLLGPKGGES